MGYTYEQMVDFPVDAVGDRIRMRRLELRLSQRQLGILSGLSYPQISKIESGYVEPRLYNVRRLAHALGCKVHDLIPEEW